MTDNRWILLYILGICLRFHETSEAFNKGCFIADIIHLYRSYLGELTAYPSFANYLLPYALGRPSCTDIHTFMVRKVRGVWIEGT